MIETARNPWEANWHMDTAVMNQTIWAVQDFIRDAVIGEKSTDIGLTKRAITEINKTKHVGLNVLEGFLRSNWNTRIRTALELRKLDEGGSEENQA